MMCSRPSSAFLLLFFLLAGGCAPKGLPSPEAMLAEIEAQAANLLAADPANTGELFAWQANWRAERFLEAYEASGDTGYIAAAVSYFNRLLEKTHTSPDGYRGWVGLDQGVKDGGGSFPFFPCRGTRAPILMDGNFGAVP